MRRIIVKLGFAAGLVVVITVGWILTVQAANPAEQGFPTDWSHRHVVFSRPANATQAARVEGDARYWQQFARGHIARTVIDDLSGEGDRGWKGEGREGERGWRPFHWPLAGTSSTRIHRDWAENMGSGASVGPDVYPAKYTFQTSTASCATDFVVYNTGLMGGSGQASIVAYNNLYVGGCSGAVPQTLWAYNTGGQILTAPVISFDGTQVAFVQTNGITAGTVVLLKWTAQGTVTAPATAPSVSNSLYRACVAPCMTTIDLRTAGATGAQLDDRTSSAFPDYNKDVLWIGSTSGYLHKITGVFKGTPGIGAGFPKQVNPGNPTTLSGPVYDFATNNVYVGDYGGFLHQVNATTGAVTDSGQLDHETGIVAAPIVDSTAGKVYVFASSDGSTSCAGGAPCSAVYVLNIASFTSGYTGTKAIVGASSTTTTVPLYEGDFDSTYYNSSNGTGNLYVCGNTGGPPILYQVPLAAGTPGTVVPGPPLANASVSCSPLTDVFNPSAGAEWIFASVQASGNGANCAAGGCVMNFVDTPRLSRHAYSVGQVVIDTHFQAQVVMTAGTSGAATPAWSTTPASNTTDGTVTWIDQGTYSANIAPWQPNTIYAMNAQALDGNGAVVVNTKIGNTRSNSTPPTWSVGIGSTTTETGGGPHWVNVGSPATHSLAAAGGTSGISIDNTVGSAGASQVYFSTLGNQTCATSGGTGGCAVQASQAALQ
jgi:hypothetical protein